LNFYGNRTSGTLWVAATLKANPLATPKEPLFAHAFFVTLNFGFNNI